MNAALLNIKEAFDKARKSNRDFSYEGRKNELITDGIDHIILGLNAIASEYLSEEIHYKYIEEKINKIKNGVQIGRAHV